MLKNINKSEILIYAIAWAIVFMVPLAQTESNDSSVWTDIIEQWKVLLPYFVLFIIHYIAGICILLRKRMTIGYTLTALALLFAFFIYINYATPSFLPFDNNHVPNSEMMHRPPMPEGMAENGPMEEGEMGTPPDTPDNMGMAPPALNEKKAKPETKGKKRTGHNDGKIDDGGPHDRDHKIHSGIMGPKLSRIIMAILMLCANMAVYLFFRQREDEERLRNLEKEQLKQELEYLKYQVNPHFFMNTLNNIHALVDIDSEKAKASIVELSKLMRYMLYDGSAEQVPVAREIEFLNHYVCLMQLRYDDTVDINIETPHEVPYMQIPPLLFISFVENAFKHGISYQQKSFIHINLEISDDKVITFVCNNSKFLVRPTLSNAPQQKTKESGIGLENVRKRLSLLFPGRHDLSITETDKEFQVKLKIKC